jgi:hypothetical protein
MSPTDALVDQAWQNIVANDAALIPAQAMDDILTQLTTLKTALNALE